MGKSRCQESNLNDSASLCVRSLSGRVLLLVVPLRVRSTLDHRGALRDSVTGESGQMLRATAQMFLEKFQGRERAGPFLRLAPAGRAAAGAWAQHVNVPAPAAR